MNCGAELLRVGNEANIRCRSLSSKEAEDFISTAFFRFPPTKRTGHLALRLPGAVCVPIEEIEFSFPSMLPNGPLNLF